MQSTSFPVSFMSLGNEDKFGKIYFPCGKMNCPHGSLIGHEQAPLAIQISHLYKTLSNTKVGDYDYSSLNDSDLTAIPHIEKPKIVDLDVCGIVAMGDAVHYPGYTKSYSFKKNIFGRVKRIQHIDMIMPKYVEFLILTKKRPIPFEYVASRSNSQSCLCEIDKECFRFHVRSIDQAIKGIENSKTKVDMITDHTSINAFRFGVPILFEDPNIYKDITRYSGMMSARKAEWYEFDKKWNVKIN